LAAPKRPLPTPVRDHYPELANCQNRTSRQRPDLAHSILNIRCPYADIDKERSFSVAATRTGLKRLRAANAKITSCARQLADLLREREALHNKTISSTVIVGVSAVAEVA